MYQFKGMVAAMPTPFNADETINFDGFKKFGYFHHGFGEFFRSEEDNSNKGYDDNFSKIESKHTNDRLQSKIEDWILSEFSSKFYKCLFA